MLRLLFLLGIALADVLPSIYVPDGKGGTRRLVRSELLKGGYISKSRTRRHVRYPIRHGQRNPEIDDDSYEGPQLEFYPDCSGSEAVEPVNPASHCAADTPICGKADQQH